MAKENKPKTYAFHILLCFFGAISLNASGISSITRKVKIQQQQSVSTSSLFANLDTHPAQPTAWHHVWHKYF